MTRHVGILLAAGASRRMRGQDKLLKKVQGRPLLRIAAEQMVLSDLDEVFVALPPDRSGLVAALDGLNVTHVTIANATMGMGASLSNVVRTVEAAQSYVVGLADMPDIRSCHYNKVLAKLLQSPEVDIVIANDPQNKRGHPVGFDGKFQSELEKLSGDKGAKSIIAAQADRVIDIVLDSAVTCDLDTREAWAAWEKVKG